MNQYYDELRPCEKEKVDINTFMEKINNNKIVVLKGNYFTVCIGHDLSLRVNSSIGLNNEQEYKNEIEKIRLVKKHKYKTDIMMDLSTVKMAKPLYTEIISEIGCPVGTIPYYVCFNNDSGIEKNELLYTIEKQAESGVSFMTLHLTADISLGKKAYLRKIPVISRGGNILMRDMVINNRKINILLENLDEIIKICKKYNIVISIGSTFRPSSQYDALDEIHMQELNAQKLMAKYLISQGIHIIQEGVGHIPLHKIPQYISELRRDFYIPFMPLGPIVSDRTQGLDHICSAIGASYMALLGGADVINAVTREEHTGGIPSEKSILEAIETARTVSTIIDETRFFSFFNKHNENIYNCIGIPDKVGCSRCGVECPFIWNKYLQENNILES